MSPEPFDSRAKAPPAKRWEKGYGDENGETGELEARETGDEHARDHGKEKGERRNACENSVDFLAILSFSRHGTFPEFLSLRSDRF